MRILAFSDLHAVRHRAEAIVAASRDADLVIGAGDFCNMRRGLPGAMNLLSGLVAPMVAVPGNAESTDELRDAAHAGTTVLHGEGIEFGGLHLFGLGCGVPVTPFGAWSCDLSEAEAAALLAPCVQADIMILHSPPRGVADVTSGGQSVGSEAIRAAIERIQPRFAVCGHVHDSWGTAGRIGRTEVINLGPAPNRFEVAP
ncbi:serine/threonine protein phosphatase [Roseovarius sp. TE539]|uniref:metallophosphoesterase family protein n=1 Tax=Roseovarius sp. TE539 TaxID=2249812 RepID=UPI000DDFA2F8|nr:metallophosphoesterase family protein [Roseovarius sp. TE539]RBI77024.1 serine/threonine protein phosphatase [Roseovarius sp. TE539]